MRLYLFVTLGLLATGVPATSLAAPPSRQVAPIIMPNLVEPTESVLGFAQQGDGQPNFIWAVYIVGWVLAAGKLYVECAKSPQCVDTTQRLWRWFTTNTNRQVVASDPGNGVETLTFTMSMQDVDGDGDLEYVLDSSLEQDTDALHETADDEAGFHANIVDEARRHHAWLAAHGR